MTSLWADYFREKGYVVVENERGFMSAIVHGDVCMIDNFYVKPECRGTRAAFGLTLEIIDIARKRGCTQFAAEIYKSDPLYSYILRLHKHFGMSIVEETEFKTTTAKGITNGRPENVIA